MRSFKKHIMFLKRVFELEKNVDELLDLIDEGIDLFVKGVRCYLDGDFSDFSTLLNQITQIESKVDDLRREIENDLYTRSLIPDHRGDVLGLLENLDNVIDEAKNTLKMFDVESPFVPDIFHEDFIKLSEVSGNAAHSIVSSARAFFRDVYRVKEHLYHVYRYEKECDRIASNLKKNIFRSSLKQSEKIHLRYFALHLELVSDLAEDVADRLSIYTIKREI